ncbi:hypothetical protein SAMN04488137_4654 [Fictibacillus solisalsi]|uniref:Uncharacterized protein n=1 Tax=Fictibacillus solisalsi TaxID=459525 RepID=A0A1H0BSU2_9BACL|nr:hypothetical protein [Fictibacillus solisalsi]SDN48729.1 hypothetical protein SAMN04488137_4654 [Fictibacillus solisalsi]
MKSKSLPIHKNPGLSTECYHNCRLSIVKSQERLWPWIHSHFTNLKILIENPLQFPMVRLEEHLEIYSELLIEQRLIKSSSWVESIKNSINSDQYILVFLNWRHIRGSTYFNGTKDMIHEALLYGFNEDEKMFLGLGFDVNGKTFGEFKLPFNECHKHIENIIQNHLHHKRWFAHYGFPISSLQLNPHYNPRLDTTTLFFALDRSKAISKDVSAKGAFANGFYVYYFLFLYFQKLGQAFFLPESEYALWNINIYKMIQHKKLSIDMMKFMSREYPNHTVLKRLIDFQCNTKKELLKLRSLSLKYQTMQQGKIIQEISQGFSRIYEIEKRINAMFKDYLVQQKMDKFS